MERAELIRRKSEGLRGGKSHLFRIEIDKRFISCIFNFALFVFSLSFGQTTRYVDQSVGVSGAGTSWGTAYKELYEATAVSGVGDSILVAQGTYKPTNDNVRDSTFTIRGLQRVLGGYPNGGGTRNLQNNPTTLSGDIGAIGDSSDNSYHVVKIFNEDQAVLDGFIIDGGYADGGGDKDYGGGVFMSNGWYKDTVCNCIIRKNFAKKRGGGIFSKNMKGIIKNCKIYSNTTDSAGGGVYFENDSTHAINCVFVNNSAMLGGAVYAFKTSDIADSIVNCTFMANKAMIGGGLYNYGTGTGYPALVNNILWANTASDSCDEICNISGSLPGIMNCDIKGCGGSSNWDGSSFGSDMGGNLDTLPRFFDVDGADNIVGTADDSLKLHNSTPCAVAGMTIGGIVPTTDIEDSSRNTLPTLGAYEKLVNVSATTKKWENSTGDGLWASGINWFPDGPPESGDTISFDGSVSNAACSLDINDSIAVITFVNSPGAFNFTSCTLYVKENVDFSQATQINAGSGMMSFVGMGNQIFIPKTGALFPTIHQNNSFTTYVNNNSFRSKGLVVSQGQLNLGGFNLADTVDFFKGTGGALYFGDAELHILNDSAYFRYTNTYADSGKLIFMGTGALYFTPNSGYFPDVIVNGTANVTVLDSNNLYMKSLTINSGGAFTAPQNNWMHIQENFLNSGTFNHNNGTIEFDSTSGQFNINPGGDPFYNVTFGTGGSMAKYTMTGPMSAETLIVEYDTLDLGSYTHNIKAIDYGMMGKLVFSACSLKVNGKADFSGLEMIGTGTGVLELAATDTQTLFLPNNKTFPAILHSGAGKLKLEYDTLDAISFTQTAGRLDFNYRNINVTGDFNIYNGTDTTFVNLMDRRINVGGNADLNGQSGYLLNLNPAARCTLNVTGSLTANYATIGKCVALSSQGVANAATCVDSLNNTNWLFLQDTIPPDNDMTLEATAIDTHKVALSWNPSAIDSLDADSVGIWYKTGDYPDSAYDPSATLAGIYALTDSVDIVTSLTPGTMYYFSLMVRDSSGNWSDTTGSAQNRAKTFIYPNLVAYYPFSGGANDASGNGNDGSVDGATSAIDRFGNSNSAYSFDGVDDRIVLSNEQNFDMVDAMSASAWFKVLSFDKSFEVIVSKGDLAWRLQRKDLTNNMEFAIKEAESGYVVGNTDVNDGKWHNVVGVFDGVKLSLYVDGILDTFNNTVSGPITNNNLNVIIGSAPDSLNREFHGLIDDVRIYNSALSSGEIDSLYHIGGWPFDVTQPTVVSLIPAPQSIDNGLNDNLIINFSEPVSKGSGNITIAESWNDSIVETISVSSANVTGSGTTLITINPAATFTSVTEYCVYIDSTCFVDSAGNKYSGIYLNSVWRFGTVDAITETPSISLPVTWSTISDEFSVNYTLPEKALSGSVKMTFSRTGGSEDANAPHVVTFLTGYESAGSHSTILAGNNLSNNTNVASVSTDPNDALVYNALYTVSIQYQDSVGNPVASAANPNVLYQVGTIANNVNGMLTSKGDSAITVSLSLSGSPLTGISGIYFNLNTDQDTTTIDTSTAMKLDYRDTIFTIHNTTYQGIWYGHWALYDNTGMFGTIEYDSVTIRNTAPVLSLPARDTIYEDSAWSISNFVHDLNSDTITLSLLGAPAGMSVSQTQLSVQWTPANANVGLDTIGVVADDKKGGKDTASIILLVLNTNDAPTLDSSTIPTTVYEDSIYSGRIIVTDPDAGDSITITLTPTLSWLKTQVTKNNVTLKWLITLSCTPANRDVGTSTINFLIADKSGSPVTFSKSITVVNTNDYPVIDSVTLPDSVYEDSLVKGRIVIHDPDLEDTVSLTVSSNAAWLTVLKLAGTAGDTVSRFELSGRPGDADTGLVQITFTSKDKEGLYTVNTRSLYVINTNDAPQTTLQSKKAALGAVKYTMSGIDDFDTVFTFYSTFDTLGRKKEKTIVVRNTDGVFTIYPLVDGQYFFTCYAEDQKGLKDPTPYEDTLTISGISRHTWSNSGIWDMVSIPASSYSAEPFKAAGKILHWDESQAPSSIYKYYIRSNNIADLTAGNSYWARLDSSVNVVLGKDSLIKDSLTIILHKAEYGWNQIASPYLYPVKWSKTLTLWEWDATLRDFVESDGILYPWTGYWVLTDTSDTAALSPNPLFVSKALTRQKRTCFVNKEEWTFGIELTTNINRDADNLFGVSRHARDGYDALDRPEPPRMGSEPYMFFAHPEWKRSIDRFASDIRKTWDNKVNIFQIGVSSCPQDVTALTLNITGYNEDVSIYMFVSTPSGVVEYKPGMSLDLNPLKVEQYRTVFATSDRNFLEKFPYKFRLNHPYPNPCRPTARIMYTLPYRWESNGWMNTKSYKVKMVIYDVRGRVIRELVNRKQEPGHYRVVWRGKSDTGRRVASGFYFCRLVAGKHSSVKKIIAVR